MADDDKKPKGHRPADRKDPTLWPTPEQKANIKAAVIARFKQARVAAGLSQEMAGQLIGMMRPNVVVTENLGPKAVTLDCVHLVLAAKAFGCSVEWLATGLDGPAEIAKKRENLLGGGPPPQ